MQRLNSGVLFKNKEVVGNRPEYSGSINVEGVHYFLDAWVKEGTTGKFFSFSVKKMNKQEDDSSHPDDDIPF